MSKIYKTGKEAREALLLGVTQLAKLVTITLGPKGRNIALDRKWSDPSIIHDGVSVANEVFLKDPFENMGAQLVKEAAGKTADKAGDGTTTSTLLAWKLIERGMKVVDSGVNPMVMKEGIDQAIKAVIENIEKQTKLVKDGDIENVATISAADTLLGKIIADAVREVGPNGVVTVEDGNTDQTTVEYKEGMMFDKGYGSPYFITNKDKQESEILDPLILYTDLTIDSQQDMIDFLDNVVSEKQRNIVLIAHEFGGYTLPTLIQNHQKGILRCLAIQAPSFGLKRIWMLEDMATLTGGKVITRQSGRTLSSVTMDELGRAEKVWADKDFTKIIGGRGKKEAITERIASLKTQIAEEKSEFEKKSLRERIARLSSGAAIIHVGARTETELKDRKERIIDAVEATKAALAEGIVAGGGIALLQCQDSLRHLINTTQDPDIKAGVQLVYDVLDEPIKKILQNAGKASATILDQIAETRLNNVMVRAGDFSWGYDVVSNQYGDMFEMGIIDPARVTKEALQNAGSVASMILTTEGLITDEEEIVPTKEPIV